MTIHIYKDASNEFRWNAAAKGRTIADSGEGYKTLVKLKRTLNAFMERIALGHYTIIEQEWNPKPETKRKPKA